MLVDIEYSDSWCDKRIYSRERIVADMEDLGLLQGPDLNLRVNLTIMGLNDLNFDIGEGE